MKTSCMSCLLYCDLVPPRRLSSVLQPRCILDDTLVHRHILFFLFLLLCLNRNAMDVVLG